MEEDSDDNRPTAAMGVVDPDAVDSDPTMVVLDDRLQQGSDVGGYIVDGEVGHGGMGVVYAATHPVIGKRAAIKVLKPELSQNHTAVERFVLEARAVNQIGHPNIVDIFAFGALPDGRSYYVMDLLAGESLRARCKRGPLHVAEAVVLIDEIASALIAAHGKGIVHRDLKPDNVFLVAHPGRVDVKLLDWGLAKLAPALGGKARTLAGSVLGTPVYMSPEQARASGEVDHRTDIYALGVMSYELLSGTVPFKKGSSIDTMLAHQDEPVPPLLDRVPTLPEEVAQLIEAMLAKNADDRPTLAAVRAVIKRLKGTKIPTMTAAGLSIDGMQIEPAFEVPEPSRSPVTVQDIHLEASQELTNPRPLQSRSSTSPPHRAHPRPATPLPLPAPERPSAPVMSAQFPTTVTGYSAPGMYPAGSVPPDVRYSSPGMSLPHPALRGPRSTSWLVIAIAAVVASAIGVVIALAI